MLIELSTLNKAVSEAGLLGWQHLVLFKADHATGVTLFHGGGGELMVKLRLKFLAKDGEVKASMIFRCLH